jgi:hypothetical protein
MKNLFTKILVFADAHKADKKMYSDLIKHIELGKIKTVRFLGDIDYAEGYLNYMNFKKTLLELGVDVKEISGNHDAAWQDYAWGIEDRVVGPIKGNEKELDIRNEDEVIDFLTNLDSHLIEDNIFYAHAFPVGKVYSGPLGTKKLEGDRRLKVPHLWHYSFGTDNSTGEGYLSNDLGVIAQNFKLIKNNNCNFMIKGHEHMFKIWTFNNRTEKPNNGIIPLVGDMIKVDKPSIVQTGMFAKGQYIIVTPGENTYVSFREV